MIFECLWLGVLALCQFHLSSHPLGPFVYLWAFSPAVPYIWNVLDLPQSLHFLQILSNPLPFSKPSNNNSLDPFKNRSSKYMIIQKGLMQQTLSPKQLYNLFCVVHPPSSFMLPTPAPAMAFLARISIDCQLFRAGTLYLWAVYKHSSRSGMGKCIEGEDEKLEFDAEEANQASEGI